MDLRKLFLNLDKSHKIEKRTSHLDSNRMVLESTVSLKTLLKS